MVGVHHNVVTLAGNVDRFETVGLIFPLTARYLEQVLPARLLALYSGIIHWALARTAQDRERGGGSAGAPDNSRSLFRSALR